MMQPSEVRNARDIAFSVNAGHFFTAIDTGLDLAELVFCDLK